MSFIGIVSDRKSFEKLKEQLNKYHKNNNIIYICPKNIENVKNIVFDILVVDYDLEKIENKQEIYKTIWQNAKYVAINTDLNPKLEFKCEEKVISFGLNQNATITVSSITRADMLIFIQRQFKNIKKDIIEIEEKRLKNLETCKLKTYEILILCTIFLIEGNVIIEEI